MLINNITISDSGMLIPITVNNRIVKNIENCIFEHDKLAINGYLTLKNNLLTIISNKITYISI